ncbi:MAG: glycosyltransferase, partial [Endomicrobium sp.]|nr:glycosyltransferase [Endomicrobium sp.]
VELDIFDPEIIAPLEKERIRKLFDFSERDFIFAFCGRIGKEKNIGTVLDFASKTFKPDDNIKILIIGDGPNLEEHKKQAENHNLSQKVKFSGKVDHKTLPVYYKACDAYLTASLSEMFSISMLEAMAMGLPVLQLNDEMNSGQITHGVNGYIYKNAKEMYGFMADLRDTPKVEYENLKKRVRSSVEKMGAESLAKSILEIYESVLSKDSLNKKKKRKKFII